MPSLTVHLLIVIITNLLFYCITKMDTCVVFLGLKLKRWDAFSYSPSFNYYHNKPPFLLHYKMDTCVVFLGF